MPKVRRTEEQAVDHHTEGEYLRQPYRANHNKRVVSTTLAADSVKQALVEYWAIELQELQAYPQFQHVAAAKASALKRIKAKWRI